ncbi:Asp23/Gls24 family envelope stress response protein [Microbacterium thalli]|uniref:Asp23/Gls24 family envelope stress response protein n=1 Tax=Microbacterium thalli TaxID=3027921 RepID=UPI002366F26D|nr:Asp23/Gls24 family envelope stress response protein [Microbacterium thalli]MDD7928736.1 Asp23/Gls24 family envelope stress response protein [Microbacterium thalli]
MSADPVVLDCGKTIDEISDYLESGRSPRDPEIETCPECLNALDALSRAGRLSRELIAADAAELPEPAENWFHGVMTAVRAELRAGRSIPLSHPDPRVSMSVTEGAVQALIRASGDAIEGVYIGHSRIVGDVEVPYAPIEIDITASVAWGESLPAAAGAVRRAVSEALAQHTELNVTAVDVTVEDLHRPFPPKDTA